MLKKLKKIRKKLTSYKNTATTIVEYLLIISLVSVSIITVLIITSQQVKTLFDNLGNKITSINNSSTNQ